MDSKMRTRLDFWVRLHDLSFELTARLLSTRSERRDFEEWRHDGKIEKMDLPLTTTKSKFREQPL